MNNEIQTVITDKDPHVSKETTRSRTGENESYSISTENVFIKNLSLKDIIFIRECLSLFIDEEKEKRVITFNEKGSES
ncbi:hypothetical protein EZS27_023175 [termite gut metagenome]|uniref:Uncharacterized protein n=1 Tax=termite gut metagenome TaxID=433724 RepID=A0A5J4R4D5_9ZZZZ